MGHSTYERMQSEPRLMNRPWGAPKELRNIGDYEAWLPYKFRRNIETSGSYGMPAIWNQLRLNKPIQWSRLAQLPWSVRRPLNSLQTANRFYGSAIAQKMPVAGIDKVCRALEVQPAQFVAENENNRRGIVAAYLAAIGDREGIALPDIKAPKTLAAGSILSEFFKDVGDWIGKTTRQVGAVIRDAAAYVMSLRGANGFAQFFIDASGMSLLFSALEQSGAALEAGTWAAFDDQAFLTVVGQTLKAAGAVVSTVGLLIPGFGTISVIIGAVSVAAGTSILAAQTDRLQRDQIRLVEDEIEQRQKLIEADQRAADKAAAEAREYADSLPDGDEYPEQASSKLIPIAAATAVAAVLIIGAS